MRGKNSWSKVLKAKAVGFNCTSEGLILGRHMHSLFVCVQMLGTCGWENWKFSFDCFNLLSEARSKVISFS